eukprot:scaffold69993_cov94-Attheya_sp.AAC.1
MGDHYHPARRHLGVCRRRRIRSQGQEGGPVTNGAQGTPFGDQALHLGHSCEGNGHCPNMSFAAD